MTPKRKIEMMNRGSSGIFGNIFNFMGGEGINPRIEEEGGLLGFIQCVYIEGFLGGFGGPRGWGFDL